MPKPIDQFKPASVAASARDRVDTVIMGRGLAARHRVLRLTDPEAAQAMRDTYYTQEGPHEAALPGQLSRPARIRQQMALLVGAANDSPTKAA